MTAKAIIAVIAGALVAAAVALHLIWQSPALPAPVAEVTEEKAGISVSNSPAAGPAAQDSKPTALPEHEAPPRTASLPGLEPVEFEIIDGIRVKKDRNCTLRIVGYFTMPDGTVIPSHNCEPHEPRPKDPYTNYSTEALKTLAYSDPHAGHVLSLRLRETDFSQAIDYALRSSVLADNTNSVRWLLNNYPAPLYKNEQIQVHVVEDNYVLSGVVYALGGPADHLLKWTSIAQKHASEGIDTEALDTRIADLMSTVDNIRSEVGID